jgi:hypothetical protein
MDTTSDLALAGDCPLPSMPHGRGKVGVAATLALGLMLQPTTAEGFRTLEDSPDVPSDVRVRWAGAILKYEVHEPPRGTVDLNSLVSESQRAFTAWGGAECTQFEAEYAGTTAAQAVSGDGINTVEVVSEGWEELGFATEASGA